MRLLRLFRKKTQPTRLGPSAMEALTAEGNVRLAKFIDLVGSTVPPHLVIPPTEEPVLISWMTYYNCILVDDEGYHIGWSIAYEPWMLREGAFLVPPSNKSRTFYLERFGA